jgi:tetratricopeptide (TPR) repeat protein
MVPTRKLPKIAYFWPGLPQLWVRGSWVGLAVAVGFTALVNVLILATCVFGEWIPRGQMLGGYGLVALAWLSGWWQSHRQGPTELSSTENGDEPAGGASAIGLTHQPSEELYREAQQVYLQGDWVAAEQLLLKLLKLNDRDAEARLMLATLWRHQGRHREANRQLDKLSRLEAADQWQNEIAVERQENAAALKDIGTPSQIDGKSSDTKEQEPETYNIADAESSATETKETIRRHAA